MFRINQDDLFVVSGGGRGITAACVTGLARRYRCRFILLGRHSINRPEPEWAAGEKAEAGLKRAIARHLQEQGEKAHPLKIGTLYREISAAREIRATLETCQAAGSEACYLAVDITDGPALRAALDELLPQLGPVTGLLHGAGALADRRIEQKTGQDFETVYRVKVDGLENLLAALSPAGLRWLVLFSSVVGFYGNAGQADYAAANEALNATAYRWQRAHPDSRVIALNWGPWDGGMVSPALKEHLAAGHISLIAPEEGVNALLAELEQAGSDRMAAPEPQVLLGHPLITAAKELKAAGPLLTHRISRRLDPAANPFLQDHAIGGRPVLPAVFAVSWLAGSAQKLYPGYQIAACQDFKVLKGLVFENSAPAVYRLELRELAKSDEQIEFEGRISSAAAGGKLRYHYQARLTLAAKLPGAPRLEQLNLAPTLDRPGEELYQDGTLFHGPTFRGIQRVLNMDRAGLALEGRLPELPDDWAGQFAGPDFSPLLADIQGQALLVWARHFYGAAGLPLRLGRCEFYGAPRPGQPFYATMRVQSSDRQSLIAEVISHDRDGKVYLWIREAELTLSPQLNRLFSGEVVSAEAT